MESWEVLVWRRVRVNRIMESVGVHGRGRAMRKRNRESLRVREGRGRGLRGGDLGVNGGQGGGPVRGARGWWGRVTMTWPGPPGWSWSRGNRPASDLWWRSGVRTATMWGTVCTSR